jgi:hypothetical protein
MGEQAFRVAWLGNATLDAALLEEACHHGIGTLYAKIGHGEQARGECSTAMELYKAMEMTFWLPQAEAALAHVEPR